MVPAVNSADMEFGIMGKRIMALVFVVLLLHEDGPRGGV